MVTGGARPHTLPRTRSPGAVSPAPVLARGADPPRTGSSRPRAPARYTAVIMQTTDEAAALPDLQITEQDLDRLSEVVEQHGDGPLRRAAEALEAELERARIVPQDRIPSDVVTMRSRAVCSELESGKRRELVLAYPDEANPEEGKISVLAPVGLALLGLRVGDTIRWPMARGRHTTLKLLEVQYQPEAAGALHL